MSSQPQNFNPLKSGIYKRLMAIAKILDVGDQDRLISRFPEKVEKPRSFKTFFKQFDDFGFGILTIQKVDIVKNSTLNTSVPDLAPMTFGLNWGSIKLISLPY
jgi:hypothetical protein